MSHSPHRTPFTHRYRFEHGKSTIKKRIVRGNQAGAFSSKQRILQRLEERDQVLIQHIREVQKS